MNQTLQMLEKRFLKQSQMNLSRALKRTGLFHGLHLALASFEFYIFQYLFMFKVSHQFIFRFSLFGQSDKKPKNHLSCLFTFY